MSGLTSFVIALLCIAVWRDLATRLIPDWISLVLATIGVALRLQAGLVPLAVSLGTALVVFLGLLVLHSRGALGGGDVKLLTALAIGLPPLGSYHLMVATALAGGVLGLAYLLLRRLLPLLAPRRRGAALFSRVAAVEAWRISRGGPLPYGVAIACGACIVLLQPEG